MDKINYHLVELEEISKLDPNKKPKLLLHACCAPCACYPLTLLCKHFDVTIFYNNSNIFPFEEYKRRRDELVKFLKHFKKDYGYAVSMIIPKYDNELYMKDLLPLSDEPERGKRCIMCYEKRMDEAYEFAEKNGFDYFTTVMSISRQKSSQIMNEIGKKLSEKYPKTKYFFSDFKKENGQLKANEIKSKYGMYQQLYCGCQISYKNRLEYDKKMEK